MSTYREWRSQPWTTAVAVVTIALGIAGATTMFAMLGAIGAAMMPPGVDADRVGRVVWTSLDESGGRSPLSAREFAALAAGLTRFEAISASLDQQLVLGDDGPSVSVKRVSPTFFRTFGFKVMFGRELTVDDGREGNPRVAIVTESFLRRFPGHALGRPVRLGGDDVTIVGILPDHHWFPTANGTDVWLPLPTALDGTPLAEPVVVTVRLRSADEIAQARSQLAVVTERLSAAGATGRPRKLTLFTLEQDARKRLGFGLTGLLAPSVIVLLIACGNVANLLLARGARREREMAVRAALGAGRGRLIRERLAESAWPALMGGSVGTGLAFASIALLRAWVGSVPESRAAAQAIRMNGSALVFALAVTALVPFVFGLVPALVASRPDLQAALHQAPGPRKPRRGPYGGRDLLVVIEVGLAVVLVVAAAMFTRFFVELSSVRWGLDPTRVVMFRLSLESRAGASSANAALVEQVLSAVRRVPGVERAASGSIGSLDPVWRGDPIEFEACAAAPGALGAVATPVDAEYFATLGVRLRRGRAIGPEDTAGSPPVGVISQRHADLCWPGQDPIGRRFRVGSKADARWSTVVGVAAQMLRTRAVELVQPVYVPAMQGGDVPGQVFVRTKAEVASLVRPLRAAVRSVDSRQAVEGIGRLDRQLLERISGPPVILGIVGGFGLFALTLAALGVFSVISYMVAERTREFGIRIALGATRADVLRLVVGRAAVIVTLGAGVSITGTLAVTRVAFRELAELCTTDPLLWGGVTALLAIVALGASAVPARRATRVEPVVALRAE